LNVTMSTEQQAQLPMIECIERALVLLAYFIELDGDVHVPMYEKFEAELAGLKKEGRYKGACPAAVARLRHITTYRTVSPRRCRRWGRPRRLIFGGTADLRQVRCLEGNREAGSLCSTLRA
jgi:hypothetical protein